MSSVFSINPRRRNPFAPVDPDEQDQQDAQLFTPPETGAMDRNPFQPAPPAQEPDKLGEANRILQGGNGRSPFAPPSSGADVSNASTLASRNAFAPPDKTAAPSTDTSKSIYERYGVRPPNVQPLPEPDIFDRAGYAKGYHLQAGRIAGMNKAEIERAEQEVKLAQQAEQHQLQSQYARNVGTSAPAESQLVATLRDPSTTPEMKQWAQGELDKARKFNSPQPKTATPYEDWRQQNPGKPIGEWFKIQPSVQGAQIHVDNPREPRPTSTPLSIDTTDGPVQGSYDPASRRYLDGAGQPIPPEKLKGASRLGSGGTPGDIEALAQSLAAGDLTRIKDVTSMRNDTRTKLYARIKQINPNYNTAEVDRKIKMLDNFNNGKDGQQVQSFGTFLEHAGDASDAIKNISLSNTPALNRPLNWWRQNMSGDPNYQRLMAALEPVRKEYEGFLLGGRALYGDDRAKAEVLLSDNASPAQMMAALKQMGNVANDRFNEANYRYKRVMGKDIENPFSEEAITGAAKIGVKAGAHGGKPQGGGATQYKYTATGPNGEKQGSNDGKTWTPIR
jgi:hypothetical protein